MSEWYIRFSCTSNGDGLDGWVTADTKEEVENKFKEDYSDCEGEHTLTYIELVDEDDEDENDLLTDGDDE